MVIRILHMDEMWKVEEQSVSVFDSEERPD
jgi:hypothetical protein